MKRNNPNIFLFKKVFLKEYIYFFIPIISLALGLSLLFSSFCIFSGLHQEFYLLVEKFEPHIIVKPKAPYFDNYLKLGEFLNAHNNVETVTPTIKSQGILQFDQNAIGVIIKSNPEISQTTISKELAVELDIKIGSKVQLVVADGEEHTIEIEQLKYSFGWESKKLTLELPFSVAQSIIFGEDLVNELHIRVKKIHSVNQTQEEIKQEKVYLSYTWQDKFAETILMFQTENRIHIYLMAFLFLLILFSIHTCFSLIFLRKKNNLRALLYAKFQKQDLSKLIDQVTHLTILSSIALSMLFSVFFKYILEYFPLKLPQSLFYSSTLPFHWNWGFLMASATLFYIGAIYAVSHARKKIIGELS
jgi:ABC-type lipoprotein release transport system permease subunit